MTQPYRCPECRTRRASPASLFAHLLKSGHKLCNCSAYPWGTSKHRPGSPCCVHNPRGPLRQALRYATSVEEELQIMVEWTLDNPGTPTTDPNPPF